MIEKHIVLEDVDPVVFYGVNNTNMQMIKAFVPQTENCGTRKCHQGYGRRRGVMRF